MILFLGLSQLATKPLFMLLNQARSLNSEVIYGSLLQVLFHVYGINKNTFEINVTFSHCCSGEYKVLMKTWAYQHSLHSALVQSTQ